jgi:hypothetical protein
MFKQITVGPNAKCQYCRKRLDRWANIPGLFSGQRLGKHVPAATDTNATEGRCFLCGPCRDAITGTVWDN